MTYSAALDQYPVRTVAPIERAANALPGETKPVIYHWVFEKAEHTNYPSAR